MLKRRALYQSIFTLFFLFPALSIAQNSEYRWALSLGGGMLQYKAHPGSPGLSGADFFPSVNLGYSKYLAGGFDFRTRISYAPMVKFPASADELTTGSLIDMSYLMAFKFNNGVFFRESARIGPYLLFGVGGSYVPNNPDAYLPLGGGVRVRLNQRMSVQVESVRKISLNQDYQNLASAIAFVYNMGEAPDYQQGPQQEVEEEMIASLLMPRDSDQDGLVDHEDACPQVKGYVQFLGCPEDESNTAIAVADSTPLETDPVITLAETTAPAEVAMLEEEYVAESTEAIMEEAPLAKENGGLFLSEEMVAAETAQETPSEEEGGGLFFFEEEVVEETPQEAAQLATQAVPSAKAEVVPEKEFELPTEGLIAEVIAEEPIEEQAPIAKTERETVAESSQESFAFLVEESESKPSPSLAEKAPSSNTPVAFPCGGNDAAFQPILFAYGSDQLNDAARGQLTTLANQLISCPELTLVLEGHTDNIGEENDNLVLSIMRAYKVKYFLVYDMGISQSRILSKGKGERQPIADNSSNGNREQNRRVDFTFVF